MNLLWLNPPLTECQWVGKRSFTKSVSESESHVTRVKACLYYMCTYKNNSHSGQIVLRLLSFVSKCEGICCTWESLNEIRKISESVLNALYMHSAKFYMHINIARTIHRRFVIKRNVNNVFLCLTRCNNNLLCRMKKQC